MSNIIDVSSLIDDRNREMYNTVCEKFNVEFEYSANDEYSVYTQGNQATFYIPIGTYCVDSFSHELLHVYLDYHEFYLGGNFKNTMWQSNVFQRLFDIQLAEHMTNSISHKLMLPIYLAMGFDRLKFLYDYNDYKMEPGFLNRLSKAYKTKGGYSLSAANIFIGKFFALKCDPNPEFDYSKDLQKFKGIDPLLYGILDGFYNKWDGYDFMRDEFSEYRDKTASFYDSMKKWLRGKKFAD
ncbi:hypothetical protein [Parapedobacter sp. 2B3]|uniref:hypothetical protein n=1 Tax=Parapedobacter sp. 2B3 TaxID=3342381 RepID=UPI0035B66ACE